MNPRNHLLLFAGILAGLTPTVQGTLLLSESFDYYPLASPSSSTKFLRGDSNHNGGIGWADEWKAVSGDPDATGGLRLDLAETSIPYPGATTLSSEGGQINDGFSGTSQRLMTTPIDMNAAGDLYFSALVRWSGSAAFSVSFRRSSDNITRYTPFTIDSSGLVQTGIFNLSATAVALVDGEDYLIVGKLERNDPGVDIASLSVFPVSGPGSFLTEPVAWDVVHDTDTSGVVLDALRVTGSGASTVVDEIRLGDSYADVVGELGFVYEPFDYAGGVNLTTSTDNNGTGWTDAWATTGVSGFVTSGTGKSLWFGQSPDLITEGTTHIWSESSKGNERDFMTPLPASGDVYLTALVRAYGGGASVAQLRAELHDGVGATGNMRANVGIDQGTLFVDGNTSGYGVGQTLGSAFAADTTYLLAMKRTGASVFAALIPADGNPATLAAEPVWQLQDNVATGVTFRSIRLLTNSTDANKGKGIRIDELRVANTWDAAVYGMTFADPDAGPFAITKAEFNGSNEFEVTVTGLTPGMTYFLQRDPDLSGGFATTVDTKVAGSSTEILKDATPPADKAFYRVSD
ncbi:MAG: hypothetical protein ACPG4K_00250 [Haloferula sp.]